jgi:hypothetical protein
LSFAAFFSRAVGTAAVEVEAEEEEEGGGKEEEKDKK